MAEHAPQKAGRLVSIPAGRIRLEKPFLRPVQLRTLWVKENSSGTVLPLQQSQPTKATALLTTHASGDGRRPTTRGTSMGVQKEA